MIDIFKALSDPTRRAVLELLRDGPMTAGQLADHFQVTRPAMSAHFSVLREADLVGSERVGKTIVYRLKLSVLEEAMLKFAETMRFGRSGSEHDRAADKAGFVGEQP